MYDYKNNEDIEKILVDAESIGKRVKELALQIDKDYADKRLVMVGILKGSFIFFGDLVRNLTIPHRLP